MPTDLNTPESAARYAAGVKDAIGKGWLPTAVRLVNPSNPEEARVVHLDEATAKRVAQAVGAAFK